MSQCVRFIRIIHTFISHKSVRKRILSISKPDRLFKFPLKSRANNISNLRWNSYLWLSECNVPLRIINHKHSVRTNKTPLCFCLFAAVMIISCFSPVWQRRVYQTVPPPPHTHTRPVLRTVLVDTETSVGCTLPLQPGFITWMEFHLIFTWNAPSCPTCLYLGLKMMDFYHKWTKSTAPALSTKRFTLLKGQRSSRHV